LDFNTIGKSTEKKRHEVKKGKKLFTGQWVSSWRNYTAFEQNQEKKDVTR